MNKQIAVLVVSSLAAGLAQAQAQAPSSGGIPITANVSLTTNYKFRGQDQGNNKPALQGGFDWTGGGFYLGNWNSTIGFTNAGIEMDFYGGYKGEIAPGTGFDVGVLQYYYPQKDKVIEFNVTEIYGALSFSILTAKYSYTASQDYFGLGDTAQLATGGPHPSGRGTGYFDLSANYEVAKGVTLNAHAGYTQLASELKDAGFQSYSDYKVGVTYDAGSGFTLAGAVVGANKKDFYGDINKPRLILTITKSL
jgi:uncharacterized protein (TIGR02001 family)